MARRLDDTVEQLGRAEHSGKSCSRMGSSTDEVEVFGALGSIVKTEPSRLAEEGGNGESSPGYAEVIVRKILGRHVKVGSDFLCKARLNGVIKGLHNPFLEQRAFGFPVDIGFQVWHWSEHIKRVAALGCKARVGCGGAVKVEREILG